MISQYARLFIAIILSGRDNSQPEKAKTTINNNATIGNTIKIGSIASQDPSSTNVSNVFKRRVLSGSSSRTAATMLARILQRPKVPPPQNNVAAIAENHDPVSLDVTAEATDVTTLVAAGSQATDMAPGTPSTTAERT